MNSASTQLAPPNSRLVRSSPWNCVRSRLAGRLRRQWYIGSGFRGRSSSNFAQSAPRTVTRARTVSWPDRPQTRVAFSPGKRMSAIYDVTRTVQNLDVIRVDAERGLLMVIGRCRATLVVITSVRPAVKALAKKGA